MAVLRRLTVVVLVSCAALGAVPSASPQAGIPPGWVAYERDWVDQKEGQAYFFISVARTDGSSRTNVTPRPRRGSDREDHSPAWSASGQLSFVRSLRRSTELLVAEPGSWRVRRVSRDGTYPRWDVTESRPAWSPDGQQIAWPASTLFVVDVERRTRLRVAGAACAPRWSSDGQLLLFLKGDCTEAPQHPSVEVLRPGGGGRRVIARGRFNSADWSPDGRRIAYAGECESGPGDDPWCQVLVSNADGSRLRRLPLPDDWGAIEWVRWVDASTIVAGGTVRTGGLLRFDLDAGAVRPLAPRVIGQWPKAPAVTSDGSLSVIPRFERGAGRPALVDVRSGDVRWGRVPQGWGKTASAVAMD